jgi:hypothetical protein
VREARGSFPNFPTRTILKSRKSLLERFLCERAGFENYFEVSNAKTTFSIAFENVLWKYRAPPREKKSDEKKT